jgi:hypothetical protein
MRDVPCDALGNIGATLPGKIGVFPSSFFKVGADISKPIVVGLYQPLNKGSGV